MNVCHHLAKKILIFFVILNLKILLHFFLIFNKSTKINDFWGQNRSKNWRDCPAMKTDPLKILENQKLQLGFMDYKSFLTSEKHPQIKIENEQVFHAQPLEKLPLPQKFFHILCFIMILEKMERTKDKGQSPYLPFLYELRQRREGCPTFSALIFVVQVFFMGMILLEHSSAVADPAMRAAVQLYIGSIKNNQICIFVVSSLSFLFPVTMVLAVAALTLQKGIRNLQRYGYRFEQVKSTLLTVLIILQIVIFPGFMMAAQNISNYQARGVLFMSIINFSLGMVLIFLDTDRHFYRGHSVLFVLVGMVMPFNWTPVVMVGLSLKLASGQDCWYKRVVYYQMGIWSTIIALSSLIGTQLNSFQLMLSLILTAAATILAPLDPPPPNERYRENQSLMQLVEGIQDGWDLCLQERIMVSTAMFTFREELLAVQNRNLTKIQLRWLQRECGTSRQDIVNFLSNKMTFELRKQYSHLLKMQQLQCQVRLGGLSMRTLYQLQTLILQLKQEVSFEDRYQLHRLVALTDRSFLGKQRNLNANATIIRQRQVERLYELFINIAITMQQFWTLHGGGRLDSRLIGKVLFRVSEMEVEAQGIILRVGRSGSTRQQLLIFQFLRKLVNNSHRSGDWRAADPEKQDNLPTENRNYILIERGNILVMSNRLLNEFELSRKEAEGLKLTDIVNEQTALYLSQRLDRLIQEQRRSDSTFLLPLKVSRERAYIQPYRAEVQILPELMNGIKYILHLQKTADLQQTPFMLYCGNTDSIIGITRNFSKHFSLIQDHYLFRDFTHELFNADLLAMAQAAAIEGTEMMCEFRADRMTTRIEGHSEVTSVAVVVKKMKQYQVQEQTLVLFSIVKREDVEKSQLNNLITENIIFTKEGRANRESNGWRLGKKENQIQDLEPVTYCKISNPYENLLDEKISKMKKFYRMSYLKGLLLVIFTLFFVLLATLIFLPLELQSSSGSLSTHYQTLMLQNQLAVSTLDLFTQSSILHQLIYYPNQYLSINPGYDIGGLVGEYVSRVGDNIQKVLENTIKKDIAGVRDFQYYSIYDVLVNAKLAITTRDVSELVLAWPVVRVDAEDSSSSLAETAITSLFIYFGWGAVFLVFLLVLLGECLSLRVEQVHEEVLYLYDHINGEHCRQFAQRYRLFAHELYSSIFFRGVKEHDYLRRYKNRHGLEDIEEVSTLLYLEKVVGIDMQLQERENRNRGQGEGEKKIERIFFLSFLWKEIFIIFLVIFFLGFLQIFMLYLSAFQLNFTMVLDHQSLLHNARGNISMNGASFMVSSLQEVLPFDQQTHPVSPGQMFLTSELSSPLPQEYGQYSANLTGVLHSDLCAMSLNQEALFSGVDCGSVMGGIMRKGFSEAMLFFNDLTTQYAYTPMSVLSSVYHPRAAYPIFLQILYVRKSMQNLITSLEKNFQDMTQAFMLRQIDTLNTIVKLGWMLFPLFLVILILFYVKMDRKCATALKSFFILPKEYLLKMRVTKLLKQRDVLNKIQKLTF